MTFIESVILILGLVNFFRLSAITVLSVVYERVIKARQIKKDPINTDNTVTKSNYRYRPLVSVIIAAFNEEKVIKRTLRALYNSTYKKFEVIVVNDGSQDKTEDKILEYISENPQNKIVYVYQKNQGKAHALNNALKNYINGKIVMSLDADSAVRSDALEHAVNYFRNRNVKALATNVKILPSFSPIGLIQRVEYLMGYHLKKALTVGNFEYIIGGVGSMFRASTVKKVGYYDTDTITEDIDLTMKLVRMGNKKNLLVYAEDVVVYTESTLSVGALFKQRFRWKFGRFQTFWKNKDLFFNKGNKYTKFLTFVYLPFQLFSEFTFMFDPLFIGYILILTIKYANPASYYGMFLFLMFYTAIAVVTDNEASTKEKSFLLLLTPFSYLIFFIVSIVEYAGLIKCILKWREIIYAKDYNRCSWVPVARAGIEV